MPDRDVRTLLEPAIADNHHLDWTSHAILSMAVSLKRIADVMTADADFDSNSLMDPYDGQ